MKTLIIIIILISAPAFASDEVNNYLNMYSGTIEIQSKDGGTTIIIQNNPGTGNIAPGWLYSPSVSRAENWRRQYYFEKWLYQDRRYRDRHRRKYP